jgi:hypothetical protein
VIDYHAIAKAPMPAALPVARSTPKVPAAPAAVTVTSSKASGTTTGAGTGETAIQPEGIDQAKEVIAKKNTEINMLKKESDWMKRELRERDEELKALKASAKQTPKKKRAEARPTH